MQKWPPERSYQYSVEQLSDLFEESAEFIKNYDHHDCVPPLALHQQSPHLASSLKWGVGVYRLKNVRHVSDKLLKEER